MAYNQTHNETYVPLSECLSYVRRDENLISQAECDKLCLTDFQIGGLFCALSLAFAILIPFCQDTYNNWRRKKNKAEKREKIAAIKAAKKDAREAGFRYRS